MKVTYRIGFSSRSQAGVEINWDSAQKDPNLLFALFAARQLVCLGKRHASRFAEFMTDLRPEYIFAESESLYDKLRDGVEIEDKVPTGATRVFEGEMVKDVHLHFANHARGFGFFELGMPWYATGSVLILFRALSFCRSDIEKDLVEVARDVGDGFLNGRLSLQNQIGFAIEVGRTRPQQAQRVMTMAELKESMPIPTHEQVIEKLLQGQSRDGWYAMTQVLRLRDSSDPKKLEMEWTPKTLPASPEQWNRALDALNKHMLELGSMSERLDHDMAVAKGEIARLEKEGARSHPIRVGVVRALDAKLEHDRLLARVSRMNYLHTMLVEQQVRARMPGGSVDREKEEHARKHLTQIRMYGIDWIEVEPRHQWGG